MFSPALVDKRQTCSFQRDTDGISPCEDLISSSKIAVMGIFDIAVFMFMKPFSLAKSAVFLGFKVFSFTTWIWFQVVRSFVNFQADLLSKFIIWSIAFVTLPVRVLTAIRRERTLELCLYEMRVQVEDLLWENKELDEQLQMAFKDRKVMEKVFTEIEDDYENALSRIEQLENEVQEMKEETLRLQEVQGKSKWNYRTKKDDDEVHSGIPVGKKYVIPSWTSNFDEKNVAFSNIFNKGDSFIDETMQKNHQYQEDTDKPGGLEAATAYSLPNAPPTPFELDDILCLRRSSALSQSLFSAILSLLVGAIILEAKDPCMPLVAALFIVVGMSLSSVVQFFSTIKNRPASDAVALLSFNWFILGTLASPTLPRFARVFGPPALRLASRGFGCFGFS